MTLTKEKLIETINTKIGYPIKESKDLLELILEEMKIALEKGSDVKITGFGKWEIKKKKSRLGRNPHTGKEIEIAARKVVAFHPSQALRDKVGKGRKNAQ